MTQSQCVSIGMKSPQKCPLSWGIRAPCNTSFFGPPRIHMPNAISFEPAVSSRFTLDYPYGTAPSYPKISPFRGDLEPHLIHGYWGPPHLTWQTASRSVQPFFMIPLRYMTDRHTDTWTTPHVSSNRPHLCYAYDAA